MIFPDRREAKRVADGKVTAVLRHAADRLPFTTADQPVQWRRKAIAEDPPLVRERQAATDEPVARETEGWVEIRRQRPTTLGQLTEDDAKHLGHGSLRVLKSWANAHLDSGWQPDAKVWLVEFALVQKREDQPTWLARGRGTTHDPRRAIDEAEIIDRGTQRAISGKARRDFKLLRAEETLKQRAKTLGRRLREDTISATRAGVDIDDELHQIEQQLERIRRKREGLDQAA